MLLSTEELISIFDHLRTPHAVLQPEGESFYISFANRAYRHLMNSKDQKLIGADVRQVVPNVIEPLKNNPVQSSLEHVLSTREEHETGIVKFQSPADKNGQDMRYWDLTHSPVIEENGKVKHIIQTIEDVTEKLTSLEKKESTTTQISSRHELQVRNIDLEQQIVNKIAQYETASEELNDFIYSVSHDLRAPLRRIDGFSQELINEYIDQLDETGAHYLKRVRQGAQDMGTLIDDLLKLSRISRREPEFERIDISELAKTVFANLIELKEERGIDLQIEENLWAEADRGLVKVVLTNLLSNAIKFSSKEKSPAIHLGRTAHNGQDVFFINDNGVGFDPNYSDKLFKAFDRLHSQKEFEGSGIGLATVKRIVNLHGGSIWAEGQPGEGATFYFNFQGKTDHDRRNKVHTAN